jgi:hypothetical protein
LELQDPPAVRLNQRNEPQPKGTTMLLARSAENSPNTFTELLRESGIPPGATVALRGLRPYRVADWASKKTARKPAPAKKLTPKQSAALAAERRKLEAKRDELQRKLANIQNHGPAIARIAAAMATKGTR